MKTFSNISQFGRFLIDNDSLFKNYDWHKTFMSKYMFVKNCCKCIRKKSISKLVDYIKTMSGEIDEESKRKILSAAGDDSISVIYGESGEIILEI